MNLATGKDAWEGELEHAPRTYSKRAGHVRNVR